MDVPSVLAGFEVLLQKYHEDYVSEALSDDLKKEAIKELIQPALGQTVKDVIMLRNMNVDTLSAAQVKTLVMERIAGDVQDQVIWMDVDQVESREQAPSQPPPSQEAEWSKAEWANSLGYGPQQGAIGKNGKGKSKDDPKGKGQPKRKRNMRPKVEEIGQKVKARAKASLARVKATGSMETKACMESMKETRPSDIHRPSGPRKVGQRRRSTPEQFTMMMMMR